MLIYGIRFTSWCAWGVLYPFLTVWLLGLNLFGETVIGLVVGTGIIANRVGSLFLAPVVDRFNKRAVIATSQVVVIFASGALHVLSVSRTSLLVPWLAAALVFGLANSVATLAQIVFITQHFPTEETKKAFSYENVALNIGAGIAPLLSSLMISRLSGAYALTPILFALLSIALATRMPADRPDGATGTVQNDAGRIDRLGLSIFLSLNFLTLLAYAQFYNVFPTFASARLGKEEIGLLFAFSSAVIVLCQAQLTRLIIRFGDVTLIITANVIMAAGTVLLQVSAGISVSLLSVLLITIAEMIYGPIYQSMAVGMFAGRATLAMGAVTFVWGVSESAASLVGIVLIGAGLGFVPFLAAAGACLLASMLAVTFSRTTGMRPVTGVEEQRNEKWR
jgi:hypothetical protein